MGKEIEEEGKEGMGGEEEIGREGKERKKKYGLVGELEASRDFEIFETGPLLDRGAADVFAHLVDLLELRGAVEEGSASAGVELRHDTAEGPHVDRGGVADRSQE